MALEGEGHGLEEDLAHHDVSFRFVAEVGVKVAQRRFFPYVADELAFQVDEAPAGRASFRRRQGWVEAPPVQPFHAVQAGRFHG